MKNRIKRIIRLNVFKFLVTTGYYEVCAKKHVMRNTGYIQDGNYLFICDICTV